MVSIIQIFFTEDLLLVAANKPHLITASRFIPRNTPIEISPVLLFSKDEYERHGDHSTNFSG